MKSKLLPLLSTIRIGGLLVAAFSIWLFYEIADEVLEKETNKIDTEILLTFKDLHSPLMNQVMTGITFFGEPTMLVVSCVVVGLVLLIRGLRSEATTLTIAALGAGGLNYVLKNIFSRARPELWDRIIDVRYYSFPSGHAMVSMVIYGFIGYLLAINFPRWRVSIGILTVLFITLIGATRLYLGVHWPSDILAGYTAGLVWLLTCILSLEIWRDYRAHKASQDKTLSSE